MQKVDLHEIIGNIGNLDNHEKAVREYAERNVTGIDVNKFAIPLKAHIGQ